MSRRAFRLMSLALLLAILVLAPVTRRADAAPSTIGPKAYYLALGDSLAFGLQPDFDDDAGYPADFFADLQSHGTTTLADMGCSGETTVTFINGGCPYRKLFPPHYAYSGPQLAAALAFIQAHPGQVSPVTIDIGANDFLDVLDASTCTVSNLTATIQTITTNVQSILSQLKTALNGTGDLITMTYYFPYQNACPNLVPVAQSLNSVLAGIARANGALVAPVFGAFGGATVPNPNICSLTWMCHQSFPTCALIANLCIHATTAGYAVMARAFEGAAGY